MVYYYGILSILDQWFLTTKGLQQTIQGGLIQYDFKTWQNNHYNKPKPLKMFYYEIFLH